MDREAMRDLGFRYPIRETSWRTSDGKKFVDYDAAQMHQHEIDTKPMFDKFQKDIKEALRKWT